MQARKPVVQGGAIAFRWRAVVAAVVVLLSLGAISGTVNVAAQDAAQEPSQGITTIGYGVATAPAEVAELQMVASAIDYGPPRPPDPGATPGANEREAVRPMVQSLIDAGVAEDDIEVVVSPAIGNFYGPGGPGVARVDVAIEQPTPERVTELVNAGIIGAAEEDLSVQLIGVGYGIGDCSVLQRDARSAALADATARAQLQAELMGVSLGDPVAASDVPIDYPAALAAYYGPTTPTDVGCSPPAPAPTAGSPISVAPFDPTGAAEVQVYAQVAVTYDFAGSATATPAA